MESFWKCLGDPLKITLEKSLFDFFSYFTAPCVTWYQVWSTIWRALSFSDQALKLCHIMPKFTTTMPTFWRTWREKKKLFITTGLPWCECCHDDLQCFMGILAITEICANLGNFRPYAVIISRYSEASGELLYSLLAFNLMISPGEYVWCLAELSLAGCNSTLFLWCCRLAPDHVSAHNNLGTILDDDQVQLTYWLSFEGFGGMRCVFLLTC